MKIYREKCRLCGEPSKLELGHIAPSFVIKYLKNTSITGYMRRSDEPNITFQDGEKHPLFCRNCENKFSSDENYFAKEVFFPYHKRILGPIKYDYRLGRFCILQAFRKIVYNEVITNKLSIYKPTIRKRLIKARDFFREFLMVGGKTQNEYSNHIIFANLIDNVGSNMPQLPPNINMYLTRSVDTAIVYSEKNKLFIYNKLCKIMILTFITPRKPRDYEGTRIYGAGTLNPSRCDITLPVSILHFWIDRALKVNESQEKLTNAQQELIIKRFLKNEDRILNSECTEAHLADEKLQSN
ncbi:MAG: hypothetical protein JSU85_09550 [Candidatus Zixiibacteriota bacterium]|nr:MAG: hypothetical protein JSU85_09550 [candidate division Zixibacteria bacterium]